MASKLCRTCGIRKKLDEFYRKGGEGEKGLASRCKKCFNKVRADKEKAVRHASPPPLIDPVIPFAATTEAPRESWSESNNRADLVEIVTRPIRSLADLESECSIDLSVWDVEKYECSAWTTTMKVKQADGEPDKEVQRQNYRVWARLVRKVPKMIERLADLLCERMQKHAPAYRPIPARARKTKDPHMLCVAIHDAHFGKIARRIETGQSYDLKAAESVYQYAIEKLVARAGPVEIEKIILPLGQDFFNVDGLAKQTTNGTPQELAGSYIEMFECGQMAAIKGIDYLRRLAPVEVVYVGGNHDRISSWHLAHLIKSWYRNASDVTVNDSAAPRKYLQYGVTMIGATHGDEEAHKSLPAIMAQEEPAMWAETRCREWLLGHYHKRKESIHNTLDEREGVTVRIVPSIGTHCVWSARRGYLGNRAADAFLYSRREGFVSQHVAPIPHDFEGRLSG